MLSEEDLAEGLSKFRVSEEKLQTIEAAARELIEKPEVKIEDLAAKYHIPRRSLYYYFKKLGLTKARGERMSAAASTVRKVETAALTDEAEKIATLAIGIGGVIARRYLPLIDYEMAGGKTLEMIAVDVMDWYEMRKSTETRITELETTIECLNKKLAQAYEVAAPNFRYLLKARLVMSYAKKLLVARMYGVRIPVQSTLRALHNDLNQIDKEFEEATIT